MSNPPPMMFPGYLDDLTRQALEESITHHQKGRHCHSCEVLIREALAQAYESGQCQVRAYSQIKNPHPNTCGCSPVEWNPYNQAVVCHTCGRTVPTPPLKK